ncbi:amidase family protein [Pelagicoccus sp. SDUM812003]|uniref:amidase family protein n=1 Tax=Pelagicoccus sp. SDUM812003 TaxID=3041267 RepID=UPI00280F2E46|nr:amidase family protein [Pelagicoccus sp. SDUM812003]MDQ8204677.1 amidase family protein [Pelagicoccus sp. SDUM812003]
MIKAKSIPRILLAAGSLLATQLPAKTFDLATATVADINDAMDAGALTSEKLVQMYIDRIEAYDKKGPAVNCVIHLNPKALEQARALDKERAESGPRSPIHGIPIVLKDLIDVAGLPTTGGFTPLGAPVPDRDATIVGRIHDAGGIILAKVSTTNWFGNGFDETHPIGVSKNPYNLDYSPGGSSNGSGVAMAANFATLAIGTDTSVSVQSPSSNCSLVGMVGTYGMVSRAGIIPRGATQDRPGPMGRSVYDVATLFSIISGWDAEDFTTFNPIGHFPMSNWAEELDMPSLAGKRIGVLREMIPEGPEFEEGTAIFEKALVDMREAGAFIVDPILTGNPSIADETSQPRLRTAEYEKIHFTNAYLARLGAKAPFKNVAEWMEAVGEDKFSRRMVEAMSLESPDKSLDYQARYRTRVMYIALIEELMDRYELDAIVQPFTADPPPALDRERRRGDGNWWTASPGTNNLSSSLGLPAVVVPGGYTEETNLPISIQFIGKRFEDLDVLKIAYGYEQNSMNRVSPPTTPPLEGETFDY